MGKDRSSIKIKCGNIDFVAFKNTELANKVQEITNGTATIVGRPQINEWNGNVNVQIMIDDIDIVPCETLNEKPRSLFDLI